MHANRFVVGAALAAATLINLGAAKAVPVEVGVFGGYHIFSDKLELGVNDVAGAAHPKSNVIFGARVGVGIIKHLMVEGEFRLSPTKDRCTDPCASGQSINVFGLNGNVLYEFMSGKVRPFLLVGGGVHALFSVPAALKDSETMHTDIDEELHYGVGLKFFLSDKIAIRLDLRHYFPPSSSNKSFTSDFEGLLGLAFHFGDKKVAAPIEVVINEPPPKVDSDGDGLTDDIDKCPKEPEDKDGFEDADGCPDPDNDKDGVLDAEDKCPTTAGPKENDGCPDKDTDGDGIVDRLDKCPNEPEDKDGFQDADGCADPDNDQDGVLDANDKCPTEKETMNGYKDDDGCADEVPKALKQFTGVIKGINFKTGSDLIAKSSFPLLDKAAKVLAEFAETRLEISGHTDDVGEHDMNVSLSQKRAESVKNYLVGKGIAADRMTTVGFGPDKPIGDNKTKKGKALNRRTEFRLIQPNEGAPAPAPAPAPPTP